MSLTGHRIVAPGLAWNALGLALQSHPQSDVIAQIIASSRSPSAAVIASHRDVTTSQMPPSRMQLWQGQWLSPALAEALKLALNEDTHHDIWKTSGPVPSSPFAHIQRMHQQPQHHAVSYPEPQQPPCMYPPAMQLPTPSPCDVQLPEPGTSPSPQKGPSQPSTWRNGVQEDSHATPLPMQCGARGTTWQPSKRKRLNKHGLEKRLGTELGRLTILNRIKKGRWRLTVDQMVGQVLPDSNKPHS